jgi:peptide/nickel transport system substrate-binding protein
MKCIALLSVSVILLSIMVSGVGSTKAQEYPREETVYISGDMSYCVRNFNPFNVGGWAAFNRGLSLTYMNLFCYNTVTGEMEPWLAESGEWSEDGSAFIVKIRPEAVWRDGSSVTAEDVVFSYEAMDSYNPNFSINYDIIESIEAVDEHTVRINLQEGQTYSAVGYTGLIDWSIISKARWEPLLATYGEDITGYPNMDYGDIDGCGPYLPASATDKETYYQRVDDWWGIDVFDLSRPLQYPKYVGVLEYASNDLEQRDFAAKVTDWCSSFFSGCYKWIMTHEGVVTWNKMDPEGHVFPLQGAIYMVPNMESTSHPELKEPWLRQAVAYAINMDEMCYIAQEGLVPRANPSFITPTGPMADQYIDYDLIEETYGDVVIPYDPDRAIEILTEHCDPGSSVEDGWYLDGQKIGPWGIVTAEGWSDVNLMSDLISRNLRDIGIECEARIVSEDDYWGIPGTGDFDWIDFACMDSGVPGPTFPISAYNNLFTGTPDAWQNFARYTPETSPNAATVQDLIGEMQKVPIGSDESIAIAKEIQSYIVPELPYIPLYVQVSWDRHWTTHWEGWSTIDNPAPCGVGCGWNEYVFPQVILSLKPAGAAEEEGAAGIPWTYVGIGIVVLAVIALLAAKRLRG